MTDYLRLARSALHEWLHGKRRRSPDSSDEATSGTSHPDVPPRPAGENLLVARGELTFVDAARAAAEPWSWLAASEAAVALDVPLSAGAIAVATGHVAGLSTEAGLPPEQAARLLGLLRPRAGLSRTLRQLGGAGVLDAVFHGAVNAHTFLAVQHLERLLGEASLSGERFGSMLRELRSPELLVVALLLHDASRPPGAQDAEAAVRAAQTTLDRLVIAGDARRTVEFLIRRRLDMALIAFRQDTGDPSIIGAFAALFSTEEQLKMLCLLTVADLAAMGAETLTPWKAEIIWRLFVDTYNQMTISYGDEVIDDHEAALTSLRSNRPHDITESEITSFLEGLPRRYLTLFEPEAIYQHVRLWRRMSPDDVHFFVVKRSEVWELTVITHDKPYLFSNICGVLSYSDFDILRGHALTSRSGLVLDVFEFSDHKGCLVRPQLNPLLPEVVAGRIDITARLQEKQRTHPSGDAAKTAPVIYFDSESSARYTILEIVAEDVPGLLHRMSRIISKHQCVVDLVLISTEGRRAIDVFHLRKHDAKLAEADELALTEDFERLFEAD